MAILIGTRGLFPARSERGLDAELLAIDFAAPLEPGRGRGAQRHAGASDQDGEGGMTCIFHGLHRA